MAIWAAAGIGAGSWAAAGAEGWGSAWWCCKPASRRPCSDKDLSMSPQCILLRLGPQVVTSTPSFWLVPNGLWAGERRLELVRRGVWGAAVKEKRAWGRVRSSSASSTFNKAIIFDEGYCRMGDNTTSKRIKGRPQIQQSRELFQAVSMLFAWWFPPWKSHFELLGKMKKERYPKNHYDKGPFCRTAVVVRLTFYTTLGLPSSSINLALPSAPSCHLCRCRVVRTQMVPQRFSTV